MAPSWPIFKPPGPIDGLCFGNLVDLIDSKHIYQKIAPGLFKSCDTHFLFFCTVSGIFLAPYLPMGHLKLL